MAYKSYPATSAENLLHTIGSTFSVAGRSTRTEVLTYLLIGSLAVWFVSDLVPILFGGDASAEARSIATILYFIPVTALFARRLHDLNKSGWLSLIMPMTFLVATFTKDASPVIVWIDKSLNLWGAAVVLAGVLFAWAISLSPPVNEGNRYGPDPRLVVSGA